MTIDTRLKEGFKNKMKPKEDKLQRKMFVKETILTLPFGSHFEFRCRGGSELVPGIFPLC